MGRMRARQSQQGFCGGVRCLEGVVAVCLEEARAAPALAPVPVTAFQPRESVTASGRLCFRRYKVRESSRLQSNDSVITARGQEVKRRFRQTDTNHTQAAWPSEQVVKRGMGWVGAVWGTGSRRGWRAAVTAAHSPAGTTAPAHNDAAAILRRMQLRCQR